LGKARNIRGEDEKDEGRWMTDEERRTRDEKGRQIEKLRKSDDQDKG
jgi:hypothetical protein